MRSMQTFIKRCIPMLICFLIISSGAVFADEAMMGLSPEQLAEIERKIQPVLKGQPVTELAEEDRSVLFMAEGLFPESYDLFFRHGEYLATEKADHTQAIPRLKKALELKPKDLASLELLAQCHSDLKQAADEVSCWETLRELLEDSDDSETRALKERVFISLGRMAEENEMVMRQGRRFIVYTPALSGFHHVDAELSDERLEEIYLQVTGDLECVPAYRTSIIVLDPDKFDDIKPTSWAGGFASGGKSMTVPAESFPRSEASSRLPARKLVIHEFTHNIIHVLAAGRCPTWLNEGLAVFAESKDDTFTEFKPGLDKPEKVMTLAELEKEFTDIRSLSNNDLPRVRQAYQLAGLYARFLIQNYTMTAPRQILNVLKGGKSFDVALKDISDLSVPQFEKRFKNWLDELNNN